MSDLERRGSPLTSAPGDKEISGRIERAVRRARLNLLFEAIWPVVASLAAIAALFVALSWFGLWHAVATPLRWAIVAAFGVAVLIRLGALLRLARPTRVDAFARVERATGVMHRPATAFSDRLAANAGDPATAALWAAHRRRLLGALEHVRAGVPTPRLKDLDPYALRYLAILLLVIGFFVAGDRRFDRLGEAFLSAPPPTLAQARIDAWVTPPAYTGRPPIFLTREVAKSTGDDYSVPAGSIATVRTDDAGNIAVKAEIAGATTLVPPSAPETGGAAPGTEVAGATDGPGPEEHRVPLTAATRLTVTRDGSDLAAWQFTVVPDKPPAIALLGDPKSTASGALHLTYSLQDDYGVSSALAEIAPSAAATAAGAHPLYGAPSLPLTLPQLHTRQGTGETTRDLSSHPWAGARVKLTLVARDDAGQEGRSSPAEFTLPARNFANPLARAVVEQRAKLALDANAGPDVADGLDALTLAPETGIADFGSYLLLRSAYYRLNAARGDDQLRGVVDYLWQIALHLEDGDRALTTEQLRAAEDALQQALQSNASDDEIARLTQQLRDALSKFMQALAEQAMKNPNAAGMPPDANTQVLRPEDLARMLDNIDNLARTGARDAARQLLSQLQNMMENLTAGNEGQTDPATQQAMKQLNQLGDMIRKQQGLMNQTFSAQRGQNGQGNPLSEDQLKQALKDLQSGQQALGDALGKLLSDLQGSGMAPNGKLGQAGQSMGKAAEALGNGQPGAAVGEQSNALDALRQGAQGLAQQMASGRAPGNGSGMGTPGGADNTDPLGRPMRNSGLDAGSSVRVPDAIDTQRAREIFDAIRQRLGATTLPAFERDYLERLLEQF